MSSLSDTQALLAEVTTAISKVLNGQRYSIGGRTVDYANLRELREMRRELLEEVAVMTNSSITLASLDRPT